MSNRLADEASPYLRQHADNPVDWYPWGDDALDLALQRDVPILLSIGYAACHWCHVMERESFEDPSTAELMNENFVNIKVDREERPDLDALYMEAVQTMTGHGGWPMTMFLTPEGVPFFGGTYFPPTDRHGQPSFKKLLTAINETWQQRRDEVEAQGRKLVEHIGALTKLNQSPELVEASVLDSSYAGIKSLFDPEYGGFGDAPKFPQSMTIDLLHRLAARGAEGALEMATHTLDAMAAGGMYDQIGGGFARYSTDRSWLVPHFEKMLYDNALLLRTYAHSFQLTGSLRHRDVAEGIAGWMLREMRDPRGGFFSSLDADSEEEEGKFYVWDLREVREVTGEDADAAIALFGFSDAGNFEGHNIPVYTGEEVDEPAVARVQHALFEQRSTRIRPATDDKVLAAWNGLAASALAEAGAIFGRTAWISAASDALGFVLSEMRIEGRLMRSYRDGVIKHLAFAEDHAAVLEACLALYEATGNRNWLLEARVIADSTISLFHDSDRGGFFTTGEDAERLVIRGKDLIDNSVPSANSILAMELQRLAVLTGNATYEDHAIEILRLVSQLLPRSPLAFGHMLGAIDFYSGEPLELVIVGTNPEGFLREIRARYLPNRVIVTSEEADPAISPLLEGRVPTDGATTAFVCRRMICKHPVTTIEAFVEQLA